MPAARRRRSPPAEEVGEQSALLWAGIESESSRRILLAALAAFAQRGFQAATTREISERAGMSPAAIYVHYKAKSDLLVFQVDLFPASDVLPRTILDVVAREKEIRYSSRTRFTTDRLLQRRRERRLILNVLAKLPPELKDDPDVVKLVDHAEDHALNVVHLIYRANAWEGGARDYEFSRRTMEEHWIAGETAVAATMRESALIARNILDGKTAAFDLTPKQPGSMPRVSER